MLLILQMRGTRWPIVRPLWAPAYSRGPEALRAQAFWECIATFARRKDASQATPNVIGTRSGRGGSTELLSRDVPGVQRIFVMCFRVGVTLRRLSWRVVDTKLRGLELPKVTTYRIQFSLSLTVTYKSSAFGKLSRGLSRNFSYTAYFPNYA